jgi:hypothetical protein
MTFAAIKSSMKSIYLDLNMSFTKVCNLITAGRVVVWSNCSGWPAGTFNLVVIRA